MRLRIAVLLMSLCSVCSIPLAAENPGSPVPLGISFPPLSSREQLKLTGEYLKDLGVHHIRMSLNWGLREPEEGQYNWDPFDRRMDFFANLGVVPFITLNSNAPEWIRNTLQDRKKNSRSAALGPGENQKLAGFVQAFINRYQQRNPGLVRYIQFGNEWQGAWWYAGSGLKYRASLEAVYAAVKQADPDIIVVLGGFAWGTAASLAAYDGRIESFWGDDGELVSGDELRCIVSMQSPALPGESDLERIDIVLASSAYDWVDVHMYDQPELWSAGVDAVVSRLREDFNGRVVCTEFGGPHPFRETHLSDNEHADRMSAYLEAVQKLDLAMALHFRLVQTGQPLHADSGLVVKGLFGYRKLPAYEIFKQEIIQNKNQKKDTRP